MVVLRPRHIDLQRNGPCTDLFRHPICSLAAQVGHHVLALGNRLGKFLFTVHQVGDVVVGDETDFVLLLGREDLPWGLELNSDTGEAAYRELAHRLAGSSSIADIYYELSARFPRFVDVLAEIRKQIDFPADDVVALYERWMATRDSWIEDRLRALGVLVGGGRGYVQ